MKKIILGALLLFGVGLNAEVGGSWSPPDGYVTQPTWKSPDDDPSAFIPKATAQSSTMPASASSQNTTNTSGANYTSNTGSTRAPQFMIPISPGPVEDLPENKGIQGLGELGYIPKSTFNPDGPAYTQQNVQTSITPAPVQTPVQSSTTQTPAQTAVQTGATSASTSKQATPSASVTKTTSRENTPKNTRTKPYPKSAQKLQ